MLKQTQILLKQMEKLKGLIKNSGNKKESNRNYKTEKCN